MAFVSNSLNFPNLTVKSTPTTSDILMIADAAASNAIKQITVGSLPFSPLAGGSIVNVTGATQQLANDTVYFVNYASGACTLTLPAATSGVLGAFIGIIGGEAASNPFVVAQNALQTIRSDTNLTTAGTGGSITMADIYGVLWLRCDAVTGGLTYTIVSSNGSYAGV